MCILTIVMRRGKLKLDSKSDLSGSQRNWSSNGSGQTGPNGVGARKLSGTNSYSTEVLSGSPLASTHSPPVPKPLRRAAVEAANVTAQPYLTQVFVRLSYDKLAPFRII